MNTAQQGYIAWLEQQVETLRSEVESKDDMIKALRENPAGHRAEAVAIPSDAQMQQSRIDSMAHHLSQMPDFQRDEVINKARAWANAHAYDGTRDFKVLAEGVSKLNGYGLGAFMQQLMEIGLSNQPKYDDR